MASDQLTDREREVLEFVNFGLTNDQIAERLGISSDGVKYHISQAMSKLAAGSRYEAAEKARRRRWTRWSAIPLSLRVAVTALSAAVLVLVVVLLLGVVRAGSGSDYQTVNGLTASQVVDRVRQAVSRDGQVLHSLARSVGGSQGTFTDDFWVDAQGGVMRETYTPVDVPATDGTPGGGTTIYTDKYEYLDDGVRQDASPCPSTGPAWFTFYIGCGIYGGDVTPEGSVEKGDWDGKAAIVLVYKQSSTNAASTPTSPGPTGTPWVVTLMSRLYLDPDTFLPLGRKSGVDTNGLPGQNSGLAYDNGFIPRTPELLSSLDPKWVSDHGRTATDILSSIAGKMPVYWFGSRYQADQDYNSLNLTRIDAATSDRSVLGLTYHNWQGGNGLSVSLWRSADWVDYLKMPGGEFLEDPVCVAKSSKTISGREFTVYQMTPAQHPLPSPNTSALATCWSRALATLSSILDAGVVVTYETEGMVAEVIASPNSNFQRLDLMRTTLAAAFQQYRP